MNMSSHACRVEMSAARRRSLPVSKLQFGIPPTSRCARYGHPQFPGPHVFHPVGSCCFPPPHAQLPPEPPLSPCHPERSRGICSAPCGSLKSLLESVPEEP